MSGIVQPRRTTAAQFAFYDAVGASVRDAREAAGLSQRELAAQAGVSPTHIGRVETGQTPLSLYVASQIAEALDITIDAIAPVQIDEQEEA